MGRSDFAEDQVLSGSSPDRPCGRLPAGLLGMLAMVVTVEAAISGSRAGLIGPWGDGWRFAAEAAESKALGSDVLCFGDSLVKYGVLPKVIEARSGLKSYNLATSGGTVPSAFFLLRRALDAGARPRAVIVDFDALMLDDRGPPRLLNYPDLATVRDCLDLAWTLSDPGFLEASIVAKVLPSWHFRFEIRKAILAAFEGQSGSTRDSVVSHRKTWARELGAQPTEPGRVRHAQESVLVDGVAPASWMCDPIDRTYIDRFLELAESRGISVYWLLPPMAPEVGHRRLERGSDAIYDRFVQLVTTRHPDAVVIDARSSGYDDSVHIDHLHLDRRGAAVLTTDLAKVLTNRPKGTNLWVDLPPFAGRSGDEPASALATTRPRSVR